MAVDEAFTELEAALAACLPYVPLASDQVLEASAPRLLGNATIWRERLALRDVALRWRCESRFDGTSTRFVFWSLGGASARDMLDAELALRLRPVPRGEAGTGPARTHAGVRVALPRLFLWDYSSEALARRVADDADPARTLILRLGGGATLAAWSPTVSSTPGSDFEADTIRARWIRAGGDSLHGPEGDWPVALFVALARALQADESSETGDVEAFQRFDAARGIWRLAGAAVRMATSSADLLRREDRPAASDARLEALRCDWDVDRYSLRAGALVNRMGRLAAADEDDTFLAPFRVEWSPVDATSGLVVALEPPDVAVQGELRERLLAAFQAEADFDAIAEALQEVMPEAHFDADAVRAWCDPAREEAMVLRVDRTGEGAQEAYLLVATEQVGGVELAVLVNAARVTLSFSSGNWRVNGFDRLDTIFAGLVEGSAVPWTKGVLSKRGVGRLLADVLSILLRWRSLLP
jgi:hypothetical protein